MSMPRKRLRVKTLSPMRCKTCEQGESVFLEPKSPVVQTKASKRRA